MSMSKPTRRCGLATSWRPEAAWWRSPAVKNKVADFTPLGSYRAVPKSTRDKLAGVKIMPTARGVDAAAPIVSRAARALDENRRAQLSR